MSLQAQQLAERDVVRELEEARKAKKAGHEVEWMAKLATGQVEPNGVGGSQVANGGLVEINEGRDAQLVAHCGEAFMRAEAGYQDEESDEWTTDTDDVETVRIEILRDGSDQWKSYFNKVFHVLEEDNLEEREQWLTSFHID